jgi:hypothetical protein
LRSISWFYLLISCQLLYSSFLRDFKALFDLLAIYVNWEIIKTQKSGNFLSNNEENSCETYFPLQFCDLKCFCEIFLFFSKLFLFACIVIILGFVLLLNINRKKTSLFFEGKIKFVSLIYQMKEFFILRSFYISLSWFWIFNFSNEIEELFDSIDEL